MFTAIKRYITLFENTPTDKIVGMDKKVFNLLTNIDSKLSGPVTKKCKKCGVTLSNNKYEVCIPCHVEEVGKPCIVCKKKHIGKYERCYGCYLIDKKDPLSDTKLELMTNFLKDISP